MQETDSMGALSDRESLIVARTVAGDTPTEIGAELGVSVHTVYRHLKKPSVRAALAEARAAEVRPLVDRALSEAQKSVERLAQLRDAEDTRDGDRIRASVALLDWFRDLWQMAEVMPRLAALEAQLAPRGADVSETNNNQPTPTVGPVPPGLVEDDTELA